MCMIASRLHLRPSGRKCGRTVVRISTSSGRVTLPKDPYDFSKQRNHTRKTFQDVIQYVAVGQ